MLLVSWIDCDSVIGGALDRHDIITGMDRLPFDPSKARGADAESGRKARRERKTYARVTEAEQLTVSELAAVIKSTLEQRIPSPIRVLGQVSNLSVRNHWYFSLKDESAVVSCVAWSSAVKKIGFSPKDGDEVVATGHVSHYAPQGRTQLYVRELKPVGAGALQIAFESMCAELRGLGYFEPERKKALPTFPRQIAVITSATGAAVQDVIATAAHRCPAVGLVLVDVRVQGDGAAEDVARAIRWVDREHERLGVDAIVVTRGGGSIEDLWAFNERIVADAAFGCSIPLVAAIGHESDTTVIELVADVRAATPTQAAMRLVPSNEELAKQVDHLDHRLTFLTHRRLEQAAEHLRMLVRHVLFREPQTLVDAAWKRLSVLDVGLNRTIRSRFAHDRYRFEQLAGQWNRRRPHEILGDRHERIAVLADRLERATRLRIDQRPRLRQSERQLNQATTRRVHEATQRLNAMERELIAVDPRQVLRRGYSFTTDPSGNLIRSVMHVRQGDPIRTHLSDGTIDSVVGGSRMRQRRRKTSGADPSEQMDLFE
jgi:exodeoxyribonuclease VII large subunit